MIRILCYLFVVFAPYFIAATEYTYYQHTHMPKVHQHYITSCEETVCVKEIEAARQLVHAVIIECVALFVHREKEKRSIIPQEYKAIVLMNSKFRPQNARCSINTYANICSK